MVDEAPLQRLLLKYVKQIQPDGQVEKEYIKASTKEGTDAKGISDNGKNSISTKNANVIIELLGFKNLSYFLIAPTLGVYLSTRSLMLGSGEHWSSHNALVGTTKKME
ncbi:hypothetical protein STEG23_010967, partial [Scotinomys teguina]